jgi:predicted nucleic acid-binding protein
MKVVADASVIVGFLALEKIEILSEFFEEILISASVFEEIQSLKKYGYDLYPLSKESFKIIECQNKISLLELNKKLDIGESESILICIERSADLLLIDEKKGRRIAESLGIQVTGILGLLIKAKMVGKIISLKSEIENLKEKLNFRLDDKLVNYALQQVGEL